VRNLASIFAFEAFWFRNGIGNLKHPPGAVMIGLLFDSLHPAPYPNIYRASKSAQFGINLDFQTIQFRNEEIWNWEQLVSTAMTVLCLTFGLVRSV